jgi:hypothetical protein
MKSKWIELKPKAIILRGQGLSIGKIERRLGIPRSTLGGWLKEVNLSSTQKRRLIQDQKNALVGARRKAVLWHNLQKNDRLQKAKDEALKTSEHIDITDKDVLELALSILYMGEGTKKKVETSMGSSNPLILKFFLASLKTLYNFDLKKIKCQLSLRADQNPKKMKQFWSKELRIPPNNFDYINLDKRTLGSKTYSSYKGVCLIRCGNVAIQRKLINLSEIFCEKVIKKYSGG